MMLDRVKIEALQFAYQRSLKGRWSGKVLTFMEGEIFYGSDE